MSLLPYALQQLIPAGVQPAGTGMVSVLVVEKEVVVRVVVAQYNNQFSALFCRPCLTLMSCSSSRLESMSVTLDTVGSMSSNPSLSKSSEILLLLLHSPPVRPVQPAWVNDQHMVVVVRVEDSVVTKNRRGPLLLLFLAFASFISAALTTNEIISNVA